MRIPQHVASLRARRPFTTLAIGAAGAAVALAVASSAPALAAGPAASTPPTAASYSTDGGLLGVGTASANNAWAVGYAYTASGDKALLLHWNGKSWSRVTSPSILNGTAGELTAITVVSATDAWAVGYLTTGPGKERSLLLHWNGKAWSEPAIPAANDAALLAVTATAKSGWAVGYSYTSPGIADDYYSLVYRLTGTKWSPVGTELGDDTSLNGVAVTTAGKAWATGVVVGDPGTSFLGRWNGSTWVPASYPLGGESLALTAIAAGPDRVAFAVGIDNAKPAPALSMKWTGTAWHKVTVSSPNGSQLNTVAFAPGGTAWAAGTSGLAGEKAMILRWNGSVWTRVATQGTGGFNGLAFAAAGNGWAVGSTELDSDSGRTLIQHWNGKAWS
jgi:hypothetical protein